MLLGSHGPLSCASEGLSEKITAYYCETTEEPCTLYDVYGRPGYGRNFERHVLCVQACQFVAKVEQSTETSFKLCRGVEERCSPIEKKDGSFDGFRKCIFKCDGWVNLENTKENTAYLCPLSGDCQKGNYFTKKNEEGAFVSLKACFETCMSETGAETGASCLPQYINDHHISLPLRFRETKFAIVVVIITISIIITAATTIILISVFVPQMF
ncbi:hypothetical protein SprV_0200950600 [Sparganum proliferum]